MKYKKKKFQEEKNRKLKMLQNTGRKKYETVIHIKAKLEYIKNYKKYY